jgi:hypothetical protein
LSDFENPTQQPEIDATGATACHIGPVFAVPQRHTHAPHRVGLLPRAPHWVSILALDRLQGKRADCLSRAHPIAELLRLFGREQPPDAIPSSQCRILDINLFPVAVISSPANPINGRFHSRMIEGCGLDDGNANKIPLVAVINPPHVRRAQPALSGATPAPAAHERATPPRR